MTDKFLVTIECPKHATAGVEENIMGLATIGISLPGGEEYGGRLRVQTYVKLPGAEIQRYYNLVFDVEGHLTLESISA